MDPERWRTSTVIDLCETMRLTQDYSLLPILADALMDAGYDDEEMLDRLRSGKEATEVLGGQLVALLYSQETALAVKRMTDFADSLRPDGWDGERAMTYERLMEGANYQVQTSGLGEIEEVGGTDWQDWSSNEREEFWTNYELITGRKVEDKNDQLFSCTC